MKRTVVSLFFLLAAAQLTSAADLPDTEYFRNMSLFWSRLYGAGGETLYCGTPFGTDKGRHINIEHVFPMGWVVNALKCRNRNHCRKKSARFNRIEADMHNLYPARREINKRRGSRAYGMVSGELRKFGRCDFEIDRRKRVVEPRPKVRGNIARAMFYMHATYGLKIFPRQGEMLKRWNRADPPDAEERRRNQIIERLQGRRNPFIDRPERAEELRF